MQTQHQPTRPAPKPYTRISDSQILNFIKNYWLEHFSAPTVREIQRGLRISSESVVYYHLQQMCGRGEIITNGNSARSFRLPGMKIVFEDSQP